jgi:hypothetical protein
MKLKDACSSECKLTGEEAVQHALKPPQHKEISVWGGEDCAETQPPGKSSPLSALVSCVCRTCRHRFLCPVMTSAVKMTSSLQAEQMS